VKFLVLLALSGCAATLDGKQPWFGDNRVRLQQMIDAHGRGSKGFDPRHPPVATFDWDNTVIRNDAGDATMFWMIRNDKIRRPPTWARASRFLTSGAIARLSAACDALAEIGSVLPTRANPTCADELASTYTKMKTTDGDEAFSGWDRRRMEPAYAFGVALEAGWTAAEIRGFAEAALRENEAQPIGATQTVGTQKVTAYIRYHQPIRDLIRVLQARGFDVYIISASSQYIAEVFARRVGIAADHVVGVRPLLDGDRLSYDLTGCGDVPDRANQLITYIDGKRCWVNKVIYGDHGPDAARRNVSVTASHVFTAGDSDTDVTFLEDARQLRLVINRNRPEVMCRAYHNSDGKWLINPMFYEPLPKQAAPYPCASSACFDSAGTAVPCLDAMNGGRPIPDQSDKVYAPLDGHPPPR